MPAAAAAVHAHSMILPVGEWHRRGGLGNSFRVHTYSRANANNQPTNEGKNELNKY